MKKLYIFLALLGAMCMSQLSAQNVQLHYDFGRRLHNTTEPQRPNLTTTVEMFRPDSWGNTFFFVDMNYRTEGVTDAYWEISREFKLGQTPFLAHVEYNGGLSNKFSFNNAYLAGLTYAYNKQDFSAGFTLTPMYKYLAGRNKPSSYQLTGTWYYNFAKGLMTFSGFADIWGDRDYSVEQKNTTIFLTEPQLWVNLNKIPGVSPKFNLSVGTEVEISSNFAVPNETIVNPTLAIKWTF